MSEWAWAYLTYNHSARLITDPARKSQRRSQKLKLDSCEKPALVSNSRQQRH